MNKERNDEILFILDLNIVLLSIDYFSMLIEVECFTDENLLFVNYIKKNCSQSEFPPPLA